MTKNYRQISNGKKWGGNAKTTEKEVEKYVYVGAERGVYYEKKGEYAMPNGMFITKIFTNPYTGWHYVFLADVMTISNTTNILKKTLDFKTYVDVNYNVTNMIQGLRGFAICDIYFTENTTFFTGFQSESFAGVNYRYPFIAIEENISIFRRIMGMNSNQIFPYMLADNNKNIYLRNCPQSTYNIIRVYNNGFNLRDNDGVNSELVYELRGGDIPFTNSNTIHELYNFENGYITTVRNNVGISKIEIVNGNVQIIENFFGDFYQRDFRINCQIEDIHIVYIPNGRSRQNIFLVFRQGENGVEYYTMDMNIPANFSTETRVTGITFQNNLLHAAISRNTSSLFHSCVCRTYLKNLANLRANFNLNKETYSPNGVEYFTKKISDYENLPTNYSWYGIFKPNSTDIFSNGKLYGEVV